MIQEANGKQVPARYTKLTGSELLIIEPEYVLWDDTDQLYPFVFETIGDWSVTTSVAPLDSGDVLARFGCLVGTGDPTCDSADVNEDGDVNPLDSGFVLARFGPCP